MQYKKKWGQNLFRKNKKTKNEVRQCIICEKPLSKNLERYCSENCNIFHLGGKRQGHYRFCELYNDHIGDCYPKRGEKH